MAVPIAAPDRRAMEAALDRALARSDAYRVLAAAFLDPDDPLATAGAATLELEALRRSSGRLGSTVSAATWRAAERIRFRPDRAAEHRAVFGHVVAHGCPPYETEWGRRHVFGQSQELADIRGFYEAFGVRPRRGGERPDHVACQLEFLSLLALKEAIAIARGEGDHQAVSAEAERRFLADHLGRWLPALAGQIERRHPGSGYAAVGALAATVVRDHARALGVLPVALAPDDIVAITTEPDGFTFECGADPEAGDLAPPG